MLGSLKELFAGRWQIPAGMLAIVLASIVLWRMRPPERTIDFAAIQAELTALEETHHYHDAINSAANLLDLKPPLAAGQRLSLQLRLVRLLHEMEMRREKPLAANGERLLEHREQAIKGGWKPKADDELIAAAAYEWTQHPDTAVAMYQSALNLDPSDETRHAALRSLVRLSEHDPRAAEKRQEYLEALLNQEGVAPAYAWWTLQRAVQAALDRNDIAAAREILPKYGKRFERSDLRGYYDFILAWLDVSEGKYDEALPRIDQIDQWLVNNSIDNTELHKAGFLPARNRVLRGRVELGEYRPQDALESFEQAYKLDPTGQNRVEATNGRAEALAMLQRHETARTELRRLAQDARSDESSEANLWRSRAEVIKLYGSRHDAGDQDNAIAYLDLALELTPRAEAAERQDLFERLGREHLAAAATTTGDESRGHASNAAECFEKSADLVETNLLKLGNLLWAAVQEYDRIGRATDARRLLQRFVATFGSDARLPRAMLQLGQTCAALDEVDTAIEWYQKLIDKYPALEEAARARLAIADALLLKGEAFEPAAEKHLLDLLDSDRLAPAAQVYRDAMFALCDLLLKHERFADAVSRTEDFLALYPNDPERDVLRFLLADAYRRSALELRDHPPEGGSLEAARKESRLRFEKAAERFGEFVRTTEQREDLDEMLFTYQRLALFYQADCLFELNEGATLEAALGTYRLAAARYQGEPSALVAQVQITNILLRQGKLNEAARAVERARWLLRSMPDRKFEQAAGELDRPGWTKYLDTLASSHLFREAFARAEFGSVTQQESVMSSSSQLPPLDSDRLIELLRSQATLYGRLRDLSTRQRSLISGDRPELLLNVLTDRQAVVSDLARTNMQLAPFRRDWDDMYATLSNEKREEARTLLAEINGVAGGIIKADEEDYALLNTRKNDVGRTLNSLDGKRAASNAYGKQFPGRSSADGGTDYSG